MCAADVCLGRKEWITTPPIVLSLVVTALCALVACAVYPRYVMAALSAGRSVLFGFAVLAVMAIYGQLLANGEIFGTDARDALLPLATVAFVYLGLNLSVLCRNDASWRIGSLCTLLMLAATIVWDSRYPGTFSNLETRAAGFGVNPNAASTFVILALMGCLNWKDDRITVPQLVAMAIAGGAVFLTLSRAGLLTYVAVCGFYFVRTLKTRGARTGLILLTMGLPAALALAAASDRLRDSIPMLEYTTSRLEAFTGDMSAMDHGSDSRVELLLGYLEMAIERPWLGWGNNVLLPGMDVYAHNIYIWRWVQQGCISLFAVMLLLKTTFTLGVTLNSIECKLFAVFLFIQGWFSHNLFEDRPIILTWAILIGRAACLAYDTRLRDAQTKIAILELPRSQPRGRPERSPASEPAQRVA
jgi:O-antigen ligase